MKFTGLTFLEKYHVDIANKLIAGYERLKVVDRDRWVEEQTKKWRAISEVTHQVPCLKLNAVNKLSIQLQHAEACEVYLRARLNREEGQIVDIRVKRKQQWVI
jgi:hypothetical protein